MSRSCCKRRFSRRSAPVPRARRLLSPSLPGSGRPRSRPSWAIQLAMLCAVGPNSRDSCAGVLPARAISMICWRNSTVYGGFGFGILGLLFHNGKVSVKKRSTSRPTSRDALTAALRSNPFSCLKWDVCPFQFGTKICVDDAPSESKVEVQAPTEFTHGLLQRLHPARAQSQTESVVQKLPIILTLNYKGRAIFVGIHIHSWSHAAEDYSEPYIWERPAEYALCKMCHGRLGLS